MREIKFRAWNSKTSKMVDLYKITPVALDSNLEQDGVFIPFDDALPLMQYTGLKDKNGREIYDGDVVAKSKNSVGYASGKEYKIVKWVSSSRTQGWNIAIGSSWEIIGNIYENPELPHPQSKGLKGEEG